ncbi:hypothetical protein EL424_11335 [Enterococcus faecium]|nr:hypothetical protein [Enterococcus faecium]
MTEDEEVNLIMKEIGYYLSFDLLQQEYAAKEIRNALRKIKKSAPYLRVQLNKKDTEIQKEEHQSVYLSFTTKQERLKRLYAKKNDLMIQIKSISDPLNRLEKELNKLWARL